MQYFLLALELAALGFLGYQLYQLHAQAIENHSREKDRQTIELMHRYLRDYQPERLWLADLNNQEKIKNPAGLSASDTMNLEQVLGFLERAAVGVRYDVYNPDIIRTTSRRYITITYVACLPYIKWRRDTSHNTKVFAELTSLVQKLNNQEVGLDWRER